MNALVESVELNDPSPIADTLGAQKRERLILAHLPQVHMLARKIYSRLPPNISLDDLVSTGVIGLISAIDRFDPSRHATLKTYAQHKITGGILDSLRRLDWAPRQQRKHAKQIAAAIGAAERRLRRAPTEEEIAAELNLSLDGYRQWQVNVRAVNLRRLESGGSGDSANSDPIRLVSGDPAEWPSALLEKCELHRTLAATISALPDIEQTVLSLYYCDELTLREIARIVGLHESRISQLKMQAIVRLRAAMIELWPVTGQHPSYTDRLENSEVTAVTERTQRGTNRRPTNGGAENQATRPRCSVRVCWQQ